MPASVTVTLFPSAPLQPTYEQLHRFVVWLLEKSNSNQHHAQVKPYSVWPLLPSPEVRGAVDLRVNWLPPGQRLPDRLPALLAKGPRPGDVALKAVRVEAPPLVPYERLRSLSPLACCDLAFLSPTYIARSGRDYLLPDPELLVRRLGGRWNEHVGSGRLTLADGDVRELAGDVICVAHELRTVRIAAQAGRERTGFVGHVRLATRQPRPQRLFATLCAFAPYAGIGAQTTHGLGAVRALPVR